MPSLSPTAVYMKSTTMTNHAKKSHAQKKKKKKKKTEQKQKGKIQQSIYST